MKRFFFYLNIISVFLLSNCKNESAVFETIKVNPDRASNLSIFVNNNSIQLIDLSLTPSLFGNIELIEFIDSSVIIYDGELRSLCLNSKEVRKLAKKGKGPFEYLSITSIEASQSGIYFSDRRKMKLHKVSLDGNPIFEIDIDSNPSDLTIINDSLIAFYHGSFPFQGQNFRVSLFDIAENKHISKDISYPAKHWNYLHFDDWCNFSNYNGNILLSYSGSNIIYKYHNYNNSFIPYLEFDFGERSLTKDILNKDYDEVFNFSKEIDEKGVFCRVLSFYETKNYLIFSTRVGELWYIYTYNKTTHNSKIYNSITFNNFAPLNIGFDLIPKGYFNGKLVFVLEPSYIKNTPKLLDLLAIDEKSITYTSNPILLLIDEDSFAIN